jgi:hypothetical protein
MTRVRRFLIVLSVSACSLLACAGSASADLLYAADGGGGHFSALYVLNPDTGAVVRTVGPIGFAVTGLAIDPSTGTLYGTTGLSNKENAPNPGSLIRIDRSTGAGTLIGKELPTSGDGATDITFTPDGALYGWFETDDNLGAIDKNTGAATIVSDANLSTYGGGLASNASGVLYLAGDGESGDLRTVDRNSGQSTVVATMNGDSTLQRGVSSLAFDSGGTLFGSLLPSNSTAGSFASSLITINTASGALTFKGASIDRLDALVFVPPRSVTLKKKLKKNGTQVKLSGRISDPTDPACVGGQNVKIQRKKLGKSKGKKKKFKTFKSRMTNQSGAYSAKAKVKQSFKYRAFLPETNVCDDATSKVKKVKA